MRSFKPVVLNMYPWLKKNMIENWRDLSNIFKPSFFADWECRRFHVEILDRRVSCVSLSSSCLVGFLQHASCPGNCCFAASSWTCKQGQFGLCLLFQERNMMILNFSTKKMHQTIPGLRNPLNQWEGFCERIPGFSQASNIYFQHTGSRIMVPTKHL